MQLLFNFLLFDGAQAELNLNQGLILNPSYRSLYYDRSEEDLDDVASYLFAFDRQTAFKEWFLNNGWGNSWGVIVTTQIIFDECWKHFRKIIIVKTEEGQEFYFRFYDPRILKIFLPTCDEKQIIEFFGPMESFIVEGDTKEEAIRFWHQDGILKQEVLPVEKVFGKTIETTDKDN